MRKLKISERDAMRIWEDIRRETMELTHVNHAETKSEKKARIERLEANPEEWFAYYFPKYYSAAPAPFHKRATKRLLKHKRWYEVRAWSRELAKSTRSMFEVLYLALTGEISNMLLISNSYDNAERLLTFYQVELDSNQRIINDYGKQEKPGSWETGEFATLNGVAFRAIGAGQSPRGTRSAAKRPDFILVDDIDTDEETRNPERIQKKWDWIEQALLPTVSVSGNYRILFNGNIIARDCCITRAIDKAKYVDVVNIRDKNGKSSWNKNSEDDIDYILSLISVASAQKEFYNNPVAVGSVFTEMTWGKAPPLSAFAFLVAYGDPAPSNTKSRAGSFKSLFLTGWHAGKFYVLNGFLDHVVNDDFVKWYYDIKERVGDKTTIYNYIENNSLQNPFYEQVFIPLFQKHAETKGMISIIPDDRKKPDKFSRIEGNIEPLNRAGLLVLNEAERGNPHMKRLEEQFLLINPKLTAPADGPDCVEGGIWLINQKIATLNEDNYTIGRSKRGVKKF